MNIPVTLLQNEYRNSLIGLKATGTGKTLEQARSNAADAMSGKITDLKNTLFKNINSDGAIRDRKGDTFVVR